MTRPKKIIASKFFVLGLCLGILIPWIVSFAATKNPHALFDVIRIQDNEDGSATLTQENVPYSLDISFDELLLEKAQQDSSLRVYSQKASVWEKASKNGLWAPLYSQSKTIIFHGVGEYYIDLTKIKNSDITVHDDTQTVDIHIPSPELRIVYDQDATEFLDTNNAMLRFGEMQITPEMMTALEAEAMEKIQEEIESDPDSLETANDYAAIAIRGLFEPVLKKTLKEANAPYYSLNILVGDAVAETEVRQ